LWVAINGGAAAENKALDVVTQHGATDVEQTAQVVGVIVHGQAGGFAHGFEGRKVHGGINGVALEQRSHCRFITNVGALKHGFLARKRSQAVQNLGRTVGKVVHAHH
jgi:hypothetical protein